MCEPTPRFLLCTCVPGTPSVRGRIRFELTRRIERIETTMEGLLAMPADALPDGLEATHVEAALAEGDCFDFAYTPAEGDELTLVSTDDRYTFLNFRVRDGRFRRSMPAGFGEVMAPLESGVLAYLDRRPRNAMRAVLQPALDGDDPSLRDAAAELLRLLETTSDAELAESGFALLELAIEAARPHASEARVRSRYDALADALRAARTPAEATPSRPARLPLPADEAGQLLARIAARIAQTRTRRDAPRADADPVARFRALVGAAPTLLLRARPADAFVERVSSIALTDGPGAPGVVWADAALTSLLVVEDDGTTRLVTD